MGLLTVNSHPIKPVKSALEVVSPEGLTAIESAKQTPLTTTASIRELNKVRIDFRNKGNSAGRKFTTARKFVKSVNVLRSGVIAWRWKSMKNPIVGLFPQHSHKKRSTSGKDQPEGKMPE